MISRLRRANRWFPLNAYIDPVQRQRAFATYIIAVLFILVAPIALITVTILALTTFGLSASFLVSTILIAVLVFGGSIAAINLTRAGQQATASSMLTIAWFVIAGIALFARGGPIDGLSLLVLLMLLFGVTLTALLSGVRSLILAFGVLTIGIVIFGVRIRVPVQEPAPLTILIPFLAVVLPGVMVHTIALWLLQRGISEAAQRANLNAARRLNLAEAGAGLVQRILARTDLEALLADTVQLVRENFVVEGVSIWLVDGERRNLALSASTRAETLPQIKVGVGSLSAVGRVAVTGQTVLVRDVPEEQAYRRSALPTGIRSQLLLPLRVAAEVIGVLEIQSARLEAFERPDIDALQNVSDQIAIAIDNARLYAAAQNSLAENKRLYEQTRANLREIERLNQQLTGQAWSEYLRARPGGVSGTLDTYSGVIEPYADWTASLEEAARKRETTVRTTTQARVIAFPISVRGQAIGAMEFELDSDQVIEPEQVAAIEEVINRMALSTENIRLFDEAQRIAQREAMVNEISERMQGTTSVEVTIAAVAQGLASVMRASRVAVRIGTVPAGQNAEGASI